MGIPRILITPGEPAGIGPDIIVQIAQQAWPAELIVVTDPNLLSQRANQLSLPLRLIEYVEQTTEPHCPGTLKIIPLTLNSPVIAGTLNPANAEYVINTLKTAALLAQNKTVNAIVTGPVNKEILNQAGINFTGHTEFFAQFCHVKHTVMLFVVNELKVALATTHLPLAKVPQAITQSNLRITLEILNRELKQKFKISAPRLLICGLNPHAGEGGYLGREEIEIIAPICEELRKEGINILGPLPADTIFTAKYLQQADAILAMYHDQALPLIKYIGFNHAVNVTLGLPFIRTSVDHGTALDIAGSGQADAGSMAAAIQLAIHLP